MANERKTRRTPEEIAAAEEAKLRTLRAKLEQKQIKSALGYYQGADRGRKNRDWRVSNGSADLNLLPEQLTLVARSRHMVANTSEGKSAILAYRRNMVGVGIATIPTATDKDGNDLPKLNTTALDLFTQWGADQSAVDVEGRRTWPQMQDCVVSEQFITGDGILIWSYVPHPKRVGLQLQLVEHEQFDTSLQSYEGNEVRNGIEVDANGRPVAYHFYRRNPNDYLGRTTLDSVRVPADRVLHHYRAERAQQSHGEPRLAPVLQEMRDLKRFREATLWRAMMEACIGLIVKRNGATGLGASPTLPYEVGNTGTTAGGMRTAPMAPGMVWEGAPGEEISTLVPTSHGNGFAPFNEIAMRGIGAGVGISYGALTRHNDANYSAARQDMLEDEREIKPHQNLFIDQICMRVWCLFYAFAVAEGKLDIADQDFFADFDRYTAAEYIPPARAWIDPKNEIDAYEKAIKLRILTRAEVVAMQGGRFSNTLKAIASERKQAAAEGITFPEDVEATAVTTEANAEKTKADAEVAKVEVEKANADTARIEAEKPTPEPRPLPTDPTTAEMSRKIDAIASRLKVQDVPNYRPGNDAQRCATCSHSTEGRCAAYDFAMTPASVCDAWEAKPLAASPNGGGVGQPPPLQDGEKPFDRTSARDDH